MPIEDDIKYLREMPLRYPNDLGVEHACKNLTVILTNRLPGYVSKLTEEEKELLINNPNANGKIKAITMLRQRTGLGLAESKNLVEDEMWRMGITGH